MELLETILLTLQVTNILSKKYDSSSEESIENLIYYKDCNHKRKDESTPQPLRFKSQPTQECKMCCTMCCGDECVNNQQQSLMSKQSSITPGNLMPQVNQPVQPAIFPKGRKKKIKQVPGLQPPTGGRRNVEFSRQHIKSLISQDQDIRKILKDLVRVTMKKVDLLEMINTRRNMINENSEINNSGRDFQD